MEPVIGVAGVDDVFPSTWRSRLCPIIVEHHVFLLDDHVVSSSQPVRSHAISQFSPVCSTGLKGDSGQDQTHVHDTPKCRVRTRHLNTAFGHFLEAFSLDSVMLFCAVFHRRQLHRCESIHKYALPGLAMIGETICWPICNDLPARLSEPCSLFKNSSQTVRLGFPLARLWKKDLGSTRPRRKKTQNKHVVFGK